MYSLRLAFGNAFTTESMVLLTVTLNRGNEALTVAAFAGITQILVRVKRQPRSLTPFQDLFGAVTNLKVL
eukprot:1658510-Amphidinium_carterae.1